MTTETIETNVDANTISKEMKLKAAYEVLKDKALIQEMINAQHIGVKELEGFIDTIVDVIVVETKTSNDDINAGRTKKAIAVAAISDAFITISTHKKNKDFVFQTLMQYGPRNSKSIASLIANINEMIETLKACDKKFLAIENEWRLDDIKKLVDNLGNEHEDHLDTFKDLEKAIEELKALKERAKNGIGAENKPEPKAQTEGATTTTRKPVPPKWFRFEHEGNEYFINRSPSGRAKGELAEYLKKTGYELKDLIVEESEVDHSKVVTADDLGLGDEDGKLSERVRARAQKSPESIETPLA